MIIKTSTGKTIDTSTDMTPEERHILQKLFAWESLVESVDQFRKISDKALKVGWNNSGPVRKRPDLSQIISDMEHRVRQRLTSSS